MSIFDFIRIYLDFGLYIQNLLLDEILLYDFDFLYSYYIFSNAHRHTLYTNSFLTSRVLVTINIINMLFLDSMSISLYVGLYIQNMLLDEILLYDFDVFINTSCLKHIDTL